MMCPICTGEYGELYQVKTEDGMTNVCEYCKGQLDVYQDPAVA